MEPGYHNCQIAILSKTRSLFYFLDSTTYDEVAPKVEFWVKYTLGEYSTTIGDLVKEISPVAWRSYGSHPSVARFFKEFRDASHRSEQARSFVDELCPHILRWFAAAPVENLSVDSGGCPNSSRVATGRGKGFINVASSVGYLIEWDLLSCDLEEQRDAARVREPKGQAERRGMAAGAPAEAETPVGFVPKNLPAAPVDIDTPYSVLRSITSPSTPGMWAWAHQQVMESPI
ncbi:hypothetical protein BDM02DRAFT_3272458 [Thelephora ganbajun]|uniref:Uncharacterized protein n=1 Tax=Thelephora ganbajun TaxID=370292 RepID=A0ACB6Z3U2_THEGA|nr:hypothetical protein BDM02DRAFT_3272458 [Thelephora ganbajun]